MLWGCKGKEFRGEPIEVTHVDPFKSLVPIAEISNGHCLDQSITHSSRLKSLNPHNPSSFAFHTP